MSVTVYSKPSCAQCALTYRVLDAHGVEYTVIDVTTTPEAVAYITGELGYFQAPVVVVDVDTHWSGFRPDLIQKHTT